MTVFLCVLCLLRVLCEKHSSQHRPEIPQPHSGEHLYGFDASFLVCVSLNEPARPKWKARGYDNGQVLLLPDQNLLLILSEKGDVALVAARPDSHKEVARFKVFEGKTWNHPVIAHGKLFVRNGAEAACYQLVEENGQKAQVRRP